MISLVHPKVLRALALLAVITPVGAEAECKVTSEYDAKYGAFVGEELLEYKADHLMVSRSYSVLEQYATELKGLNALSPVPPCGRTGGIFGDLSIGALLAHRRMPRVHVERSPLSWASNQIT